MTTVVHHLVAGVDPGIHGGIAVLSCDKDYNLPELIHLGLLRDDPIVAPTLARLVSERVVLDEFGMSCLEVCSVAGVFVEKAQVMNRMDRGAETEPPRSARAAFSYGVGFGTICGAIRGAVYPLRLVPPSVWTRVMHAGCKLATEDKQRSFEACRNLFPGVNLVPPGGRVPHDGLAEALLMAEYGRRILKAGG
jgi:hypothetical protein